MSITTRTGDTGTTSLYSGERVDKCSARPAALGDLDELASILGLARLHCTSQRNRNQLLTLQRRLFVVGAEIATTPEKLSRLRRRLDDDLLAELDGWRDALEAEVELPNGFVVPAASPAAAYLDHARAVSRRCERDIVALYRSGDVTNEQLLAWVNRLSDYLYLMARSEEEEPIMVNVE